MPKHLVMTETFGIRRVDPHFCPHERTVFVQDGSVYTVAGEYDDNLDSYAQCLDCGWVKRDDGGWGPVLETEAPIDKIAF